jgi:hypothetical protein
MKSAIFSGSKKIMEILFTVQPTLPSKNKIVPDLSEHDCTAEKPSTVQAQNLISHWDQ